MRYMFPHGNILSQGGSQSDSVLDQPETAPAPGAGQSTVVAGQTATGAGQAAQAAPCLDEAAIDVNDSSVQGAHIYAYKDPNDPKRFSFFAVDDKGSAPVTGCFNRTTDNNEHELPPGDYTLSPRPRIAVKTGSDGGLQLVGSLSSGNSSGDPNRHERSPAISNSDDWNTIQLPDGRKMKGAAIHPGKDPITGEGGDSLGCMVTTKYEYDQLNNMLQGNYAHGGAYLRVLPYKYFPATEDMVNNVSDPSFHGD